MTALDVARGSVRRHQRRLPHPRRRVPLLGDVFAIDSDKPSQSMAALAAELGPIFEVRALGGRYVVAAGR